MTETKANSDSIFYLAKKQTYNENTYDNITKKLRRQDGTDEGNTTTTMRTTMRSNSNTYHEKLYWGQNRNSYKKLC